MLVCVCLCFVFLKALLVMIARMSYLVSHKNTGNIIAFSRPRLRLAKDETSCWSSPSGGGGGRCIEIAYVTRPPGCVRDASIFGPVTGNK